ncbi:hypothetical protein AB0M47_02325 [Hamadaea sp. NPDC051192]|uniref:hypothetical protein n=1 Tax=Hamadaea sp. NPDC051192 TaxID=3154940 RepID=UPI00341F4F24
MTADHLRDVVMTGAIFALATAVWFGWALEHPPRSWRPWLFAGVGLGYALLAVGIVLAVRHWHDGTVFDAATGKRTGVVVGVEFAACGIGAAVLAIRRRRELIPVWIAFVVGVHFFPLAAIIGYPLIYAVGATTTAVALAAVPVARRRTLPVSALNGAGMGLALLLGSTVALTTALLW